MFKFKNGEHVRDVVTGFVGVIVSRTDHLSGCNRYYIQPQVSEENKLSEGCYIDEMALERLQKKMVSLDRLTHEPPG